MDNNLFKFIQIGMFSDSEVINFLQENDIIITTWREIMERFNRK